MSNAPFDTSSLIEELQKLKKTRLYILINCYTAIQQPKTFLYRKSKICLHALASK